MEKAAPWRRWKISLSVDSFMQPCACRLFHQRDWEQQKKKKRKSAAANSSLCFGASCHIYYLASLPTLVSGGIRMLHGLIPAYFLTFHPICHLSFPHPPRRAVTLCCSRARAPVPAGFHLQQWCRRNYVKWQQSTPFNETNVFGGAGIKTLLSVPVWNNRAGGRWSSLPRMLCPQTEGAVRLLPPLLLSVLQIKGLDPLNIWRILLGKKW